MAALAGALTGAPQLAQAGRPGVLPQAAGEGPPAVERASFSQDGQQVVWEVRLGQRFSAAGLRRDGLSLCLALERLRGGSVASLLCVQPRRNGSGEELVWMRVTAAGRGRPHVISGSISRSSPESLTARFLPSEVGAAYKPLRWQVLTGVSTGACNTSERNSPACVRYFPGRPTLTRLHTPQPVGCVPTGPSFVTNGTRRHHVIALTFDDGPWPDTPSFLRLLQREHVHATFFQIGDQVSTYGRGVDRRILDDGDIIGDHTWNHADVSGGGAFAAGEIAGARGAIRRMTGFTPCLFRAPGGAVSPGLIGLARSMGFLTIQWDVDPRDWSRPGTDSIYGTVTSQARNGSIVLQHDGGGDRSETLAALPREIRFFKQHGYRFVTIPQLLGMRVLYR